jgi:hypothetical protein
MLIVIVRIILHKNKLSFCGIGKSWMGLPSTRRMFITNLILLNFRRV